MADPKPDLADSGDSDWELIDEPYARSWQAARPRLTRTLGPSELGEQLDAVTPAIGF